MFRVTALAPLAVRGREVLYARTGNAAHALEDRERLDYHAHHWPGVGGR